MTQLLDRVVVVNRIALPVKAPDRVLMVPWGNVESTSGDFIVDAHCAPAVIEAFKAHRVDLPIDLEHATLGGEFSSPTGEAPAVGWIKSLSAVEGEGIFAEVEWTEHGAELVETKAYRYLSPVTLVWKKDQRLAALHSVALTNKPAIVGMHPIVNKDKVAHMDPNFDSAKWFLNLEELATEQEILMKMEEFLTQLRGLVGAAESADQVAVLSALKQKLGDTKAAGEFRTAVCKSLAVQGETKDEELIATINARLTPADKVVSRQEFDAVVHSQKKAAEDAASAKAELLDIKVNARVADAKALGKLTDKMLEPDSEGNNHFLHAARDEKGWKSLMERMPVVAPRDGKLVNNAAVASRAPGGDAIVAHQDRFDAEGMDDYKRIMAHQKEHKCSFEEAMTACGAL